jgi:hypothetical protein
VNSLLALGARALTMSVALVCGVLTTRLILGDAGIQYYALYNLLVTLPSLLSFTDFGSGAVLVNSVATSADVRRDNVVLGQLTSVGRILVGFSASTMVVNLVLLLSGGWTLLLGDAGDRPFAAVGAFCCVSIFCLGVPIGIWVRLMLGLRRNHVVILLQGLISPLTLLGVWTVTRANDVDAFSFLAVSSFAASFLVSVIGLTITARKLSPLVGTARRHLFRPQRFPGARVMDVGWPMLAQLVTFPLAVSTQRYVLAHLGTEADVAQYGVVGQVFFALNGLVIAAGTALWPYFASKRHAGQLRHGPFRLSALFCASIACATGVLMAGGGPVFAFITNGRLQVSLVTVAAFGAMICSVAALYPLGMFIMDKPGIKFQVVPTLLMALVSVCLSLVLAPRLGAAGPPLGNAVAIVICQIVPFTMYIRRHRDRLLGCESSDIPASQTVSS